MAAGATGFLQSYSDRLHEHNLLDLQDEVGRRKSMADELVKQIDDPRTRPEHVEEYQRQLHVLHSTPYHQRLHKDIGNLAVKIAPQQGGSLATPAPQPSTPNVPSGAPGAGFPTPVLAQPPSAPVGPHFSPTEIGQREAAKSAPQQEQALGVSGRQLEQQTRIPLEVRVKEAKIFAQETGVPFSQAYLMLSGHGALIPKPLTRGVLGSELAKSDPNLRTMNGEQLDPNTRYDHFQIGTERYAAPSGIPASAMTDRPIGRVGGAVAGVTINGKSYYDDDPNIPANARKAIDALKKAMPPEKVTSGVMPINLGGEVKIIPRTSTTKSVRSGGAASNAATPKLATLPSSGISFPKTLPPVSAEKLEEGSAAIGTAIDIARRVAAKIPVLNSLISAGKIKIATDPDTGDLIISRLIGKLSPEEARLASDMQSLSEHINTLRGPLGATGFRSHEAWSALQSQKGNLLAQPEITQGVLRNTINSMQKIKGAKDKYLGPQNATPPAAEKQLWSPGQLQQAYDIDSEDRKRRGDNQLSFSRFKQKAIEKGYYREDSGSVKFGLAPKF